MTPFSARFAEAIITMTDPSYVVSYVSVTTFRNDHDNRPRDERNTYSCTILRQLTSLLVNLETFVFLHIYGYPFTHE